ncbi:MAG: PHP domain-containing protein [Kiritimatiellae bacterium]|nr:PHP domain-containing protein [Kiritimatiellia bacterium]
MIDLHIHSTNSDGSDEPYDIVKAGKEAGLNAMALTDHDTMAGAEDFLNACREFKMTGIVGMEMSADVGDEDGTLHILGYGLDPDFPELDDVMEKIRDGRTWRNEQIVEKLNALGLELTLAEVQDCAGDDVIGRVHIAQAMINRDYVFSTEEAFDKYLSKDAPAYVDRYRLYPVECVELIRRAGGVPVVAHPYTWIDDPAELEQRLAELRDHGLFGLEVWHSDHTPEMAVELIRMADRLGLNKTGGSDYHGEPKPDLALGTGYGKLCVPDDYLPPLLEALGGVNNRMVHIA